MRSLAFLSMDNLKGFVSDDVLAIEPLQKLGWTVQTLSWRQPYDWNLFDMVVIRSTWDYQNDMEAFLKVLEQIDSSKALLQNDLDLIRWNIRKTYLYDLEKRGNRIVPTLWEEAGIAEERLTDYFPRLRTDEIIIKPLISANADNTFRLKKEEIAFHFDELKKVFSHRPFMVQPFMANIIKEGEYSLFYFGGEHSHTILKTPRKNDFRVQEEHGGIITPIATSNKLKTKGALAVNSIGKIPLYARVDFVRDKENEFAIMEVELIEPALYFRMNSQSAERFAITVNRWNNDRFERNR